MGEISLYSGMSSLMISTTNLKTAAGEFFINTLLVRIHLIIEMISVDRPCAKGAEKCTRTQAAAERALSLLLSLSAFPSLPASITPSLHRPLSLLPLPLSPGP